MSHGKAVFRHKELDVSGESQQPDDVGDGSPVLAGPAGDLLVAEVELPGEAVECVRYLDGVEVLSLNVLNEGDLHQAVIGIFLDYGWDMGEAGHLGGPPAALAGD
jgi:hypothetical protein